MTNLSKIANYSNSCEYVTVQHTEHKASYQAVTSSPPPADNKQPLTLTTSRKHHPDIPHTPGSSHIVIVIIEAFTQCEGALIWDLLCNTFRCHVVFAIGLYSNFYGMLNVKNTEHQIFPLDLKNVNPRGGRAFGF